MPRCLGVSPAAGPQRCRRARHPTLAGRSTLARPAATSPLSLRDRHFGEGFPALASTRRSPAGAAPSRGRAESSPDLHQAHSSVILRVYRSAVIPSPGEPAPNWISHRRQRRPRGLRVNLNHEVIDLDVIVVGAGGAGARAAIEADAQGAATALVTKGMVARSGATPMACPSYQAAIAHQDPRDSPEVAFEDTCMEGRYLGDENLIWAMTNEASDRARDMESYGLKLEMEGGHWYQVRHPGHSYPRNLVMRGCGYGQMVALKRQLNRQSGIRRFEDHTVLGLLRSTGGGVGGVLATDVRTGGYLVLRAPAVGLATGGHLQLSGFTDTAPENTGDGMILALRSGATLVDMEMMLYYPSCLRWPPELSGTLVQYEGLTDPWYIGAPMVNGRGERFFPEGERLPVRDVLMRLMFREIDEGRGTPNRGVYIDIPNARRQGDELYEWLHRLDSLPYGYLRDLEIDVRVQPIEVAPGAHFALGGIRIDEWGRTGVPGLLAAGECAGNTHGANRTSGNALAEGQVFGRRAGMEAASIARGSDRPSLDEDQVGTLLDAVDMLHGDPDPDARPLALRARLRALMEQRVGHRRDETGLSKALAEVRALRA